MKTKPNKSSHGIFFILHSLICLLAFSATALATPELFTYPRFRIGTLEMQSEANVCSSTVTLRQICRWNSDDDSLFAPVADLVLAHLDGQPFVSINVENVLSMLQGAGFSPAAVRFTGSAACTVSRVNIPVDQSTAFDQWSHTVEQSKAASQPTAPPSDSPASDGLAAVAASSSSPSTGVTDLRQTLINNLSNRLQIPTDSLQLDFDPRDNKLLSMTTPPFTFEIAPNRVHKLGNVSWDLTIRMGRADQSAHIAAYARAWQNELVLAQPVQFNQVLRPEDLVQKRVLVDALNDEPLLSKQQAIGQQAAMDMKIGTVLTARRVSAVPLIRDGQLVTVSVRQGGVNLQTEARALESATYGQTVRLRNELTHDTFEAIVTGPQQADMK
ncbi:MAG TPA: flagellar basal body P-ring formation chaperone FlgA [Tepidisphaeraceae bacterium]|nr:flagellar basal body P-ring formation chaperone FlgA [Tepidisphaeraceae bacterium]